MGLKRHAALFLGQGHERGRRHRRRRRERLGCRTPLMRVPREGGKPPFRGYVREPDPVAWCRRCGAIRAASPDPTAMARTFCRIASRRYLSRRGQWRGVNLRAWAFTIMTNLYRDRHRRVSAASVRRTRRYAGLDGRGRVGRSAGKDAAAAGAECADAGTPRGADARRHRGLRLSGCRRHARDPDRHRHVPPVARAPADGRAARAATISLRSGDRNERRTNPASPKPTCTPSSTDFSETAQRRDRALAGRTIRTRRPRSREWQAQNSRHESRRFRGYARTGENDRPSSFDAHRASQRTTRPTLWRIGRPHRRIARALPVGAAAGVYGDRLLRTTRQP